MQQREFHPLELAIPAVFLIITYYALFSSFNPLAHWSQSPKASLERAQLLMKRGNFAQALTYIESLCKRFPTNHVYWTQAAALHNRLGQASREAEALEQVMKLSSVPDEACPQIGMAYEKNGEIAKALDAFRRCLNLEPNDADFHLYMGMAEERMGSNVAAAIEFRACLSRAPTYLDCAVGLSRTYYSDNDAETALKILDDFENPKKNSTADFLVARAKALRKLEKNEVALNDLRQAAIVAPSYFDVWQLLAAAAEDAGQKDEAVRALRTALKLRPDNQRILKKLEQMEQKP